eukprot:g7248.t1
MKRSHYALVLITLALSNGAKAFYYSANPYHRHAGRLYGRPAAPSYQRQRAHRLRNNNIYTREKIRETDEEFKIYIPCGRYCHYYQARIKPVVGRHQQSVEVTGPRYRKSWKIPDNIDIDSITQSILPSGYLELALPKYFDESLYNLKNSPIYAAPRDSAKEVQKPTVEADRNEYHRSYNKRSEVFSKENDHQRRAPQRSENAYFYPNSDGIEILDVEDNAVENELFLKDQKASIGFWDSRGKFQFY